MNLFRSLIAASSVFLVHSAFGQAFGIRSGSTFGELRSYLIDDSYEKRSVFGTLPDRLPRSWRALPPQANPRLDSYEVKFNSLGVVKEVAGFSLVERKAVDAVARDLHLRLLSKYHKPGESRADQWPDFQEALSTGKPKGGAFLYASWHSYSGPSLFPPGLALVSIEVKPVQRKEEMCEVRVTYLFNDVPDLDDKGRGL